MIAPPRWTIEQLDEQRLVARANFRRERLAEPLDAWIDEYKQQVKVFESLFKDYGLTNPAELTAEHVAGIYKAGFGRSLQAIAGPPISDADLIVLAETTLSQRQLRKAGYAGAKQVIDIIRYALDTERFPWLDKKRDPTPEELQRTIHVSAALRAYQSVLALRRNDAKKQQEAFVADFLRSMNFSEVPARSIQAARNFPRPGEFCVESLVGTRKADISVGLYDGRIMPLECKVSNSEVNSIKRINNDAAVKAEIWNREFGSLQIVPVAILSGVFKVINLVQAQGKALTLFWAHNMGALKEFVEATKS